MTVVIALDLGTTGNRAIAFRQDGSIAASHYEEFTQYFPHPAWVEHNADEIWETALKVLTKTISDVGAKHVKSIGLTNQRETTILWNKKTGRPLYHAIVWQCRRTADRCHTLYSKKDVIKSKTGLFLDPYFSATKIEWLIQNVPEIQKEIQHDNVLFGTVDTWVLYKLTRHLEHATDVSNASRTMLFNIRTLDWDDELLDLFTIPKSLLPIVRPSNSHFGICTLFDQDIPITSILGDQQAALFAQCDIDQHQLKCTYGTGLFLVANTGSTIVETDRLISTVAFQMDQTVYYALEGSIFIGGSAIQWLRDELKLLQSSAESERLAASLSENDGVYMVPALSGLGAPYWNPDARGSFFGLTRGTSKAHIVRATLESLAYQTRDIIEEIVRYLPNTFTTLKADGGVVSNQFLMQFQADILDMNVEIPKIEEATAFGAAAMSGLSSGFWTQEELDNIKETKKVYSSKMESQQRDHYYSRWKKAVSLTQSWSHNE